MKKSNCNPKEGYHVTPPTMLAVGKILIGRGEKNSFQIAPQTISVSQQPSSNGIRTNVFIFFSLVQLRAFVP